MMPSLASISSSMCRFPYGSLSSILSSHRSRRLLLSSLSGPPSRRRTPRGSRTSACSPASFSVFSMSISILHFAALMPSIISVYCFAVPYFVFILDMSSLPVHLLYHGRERLAGRWWRLCRSCSSYGLWSKAVINISPDWAAAKEGIIREAAVPRAPGWQKTQCSDRLLHRGSDGVTLSRRPR